MSGKLKTLDWLDAFSRITYVPPLSSPSFLSPTPRASCLSCDHLSPSDSHHHLRIPYSTTFRIVSDSSALADSQGGRQLDQARTGFDSLRSIHAQDPNLSKQIEIYIDGGVRRGTDVLQALAFGAKGVGLGRTFLWSQAAYGEKGVLRAIRSTSLVPLSFFLSFHTSSTIIQLFVLLHVVGEDTDALVMEDEIIMAMRLLGVRKIDEITPGMAECLKEVWR